MKRIILIVFMMFFITPIANAEIQLLSAGIGEEGRVEHSEYSLKLVFFEQGGPYVANVRVQIFDQNGKQLVDYRSPGPWLFLGLEPGSYSVRAERQNGDAQGVRFNVEGNMQKTISLQFPAQN